MTSKITRRTSFKLITAGTLAGIAGRQACVLDHPIAERLDGDQ